jgi:hypothetical protein
LLDGQNLEPGVCCAVHGFGGFFEAEEDSHLGFFAGQDGGYRLCSSS